MYDTVLVVGGAARATARTAPHESVFPPALRSQLCAVATPGETTVHALQLGESPPKSVRTPHYRETPVETSSLSSHGTVGDRPRFDYQSVVDRVTAFTARSQALFDPHSHQSAAPSFEGETGTTVFGPDGSEQLTPKEDRQPLRFDYDWRLAERTLVETLRAADIRLVVSYRHKIQTRYAPAVVRYVEDNDIDLVLFGQTPSSRRELLRTSLLVEDLVLDTGVPVLAASITDTGPAPTPTAAQFGEPTAESTPRGGQPVSPVRHDSEPVDALTAPASGAAPVEAPVVATAISVVAPGVLPHQKEALRELFRGRTVSVGTTVHLGGTAATVVATLPSTTRSFVTETVAVGEQTRIRIDSGR